MSTSADANEVFGQRVKAPYTAKSVIGGAELPLSVAVEIDGSAQDAPLRGLRHLKFPR